MTGWTHVKHTPWTGWFLVADLTGAASKKHGDNTNANEKWQTDFESLPFNEYLFITGDRSKWVVVKKSEITKAHKDNTTVPSVGYLDVEMSSSISRPHKLASAWSATNQLCALALDATQTMVLSGNDFQDLIYG
jgi:hypothetical protein